jgi:hypothetical protein
MSLLAFKKFILVVFFSLFYLLPFSQEGMTASSVPSQLSGVDLITSASRTIPLQQANKGTVIAFLSSRCPCSNSHIPVLNQLNGEFSEAGFKFIGVHSNANEEFEEASQYFKSSKLQFSVIEDQDSKIADQLGAYKTPHIFVISPKLEILYQGGIDDSKLAETAKRPFLKNALTAIKNGQEPPEKRARALGCEIQRPKKI